MNSPFIQRLLFIFNKLDWFVGAAFLVVGLIVQNWWLVAGGVVGLISAYFQPAAKLKDKLEQKLLTKAAVHSDNALTLAEDAFYANYHTEADTSQSAKQGGFQIWGVAHNQLCPGCVGTFTPEEKKKGAEVSMLERPYY